MSIEKENEGKTGLEIAVIGMALRFPGAQNIHEFWDNLKKGVESISFFTDEELIEQGFEPGLLQNPNYVKAKGVLDGYDHFDASFFGYTTKEAEIMDPQLRVFHECAWEALENAGYPSDSYDGLIGLYAGASPSFAWVALSLMSGKTMSLGFLASLMTDKDYLSSRISYALDLKGPSISIRTTCSTSLVATHLAIQGLLSGECDMALAGGVTILLPGKKGYLYQEGMFESPDGHCKTFDIKGKGFVEGNGVGIVVLKRLEDALEDRDYIYAVIKGAGINNDGMRKVGYTAPSVEGQADVIRAAQQIAEVEPESIGYIETHGTATELGDPIEVEALKQAFNTDKKNFCAIGSVKTNIGHLDSAAGVAGLMKTALALNHRVIPPSLNFEIPNPRLELINSPFYVNAALKEWENENYPLRAGVSSFGIGGTNAHVVLEEAPEIECSLPGRKWQLLVLSAKTKPALEQSSKNLMEHLVKHPDINLADVAYTLHVGRKPFKYRKMLVCSTVNEAIESLSQPGSSSSGEGLIPHTFSPGKTEPPVVFMFPDQGFQYMNMGLELYGEEPLFQSEMDRCFDILSTETGYDIKHILYPEKNIHQVPTFLNQHLHEILQPVIFIFEYALAALLIKWGIKPFTVIGHGIGEYAAAHIAGILPLEDALALAALRGKLMQQMTLGSMKENDALNEFRDKLNQVAFNKPAIPYMSCMTGTWMTDDQVSTPEYWITHMRESACLVEGIKEVVNNENAICVEMGTGRDLCKRVGHGTFPIVREPEENISETYFLLKQIGHLWLNGIAIHCQSFYDREKRCRVPLPTYPFEKRQFKVEIPPLLKSMLNGNWEKLKIMDSLGMSSLQSEGEPPRIMPLTDLPKSEMEQQIYSIVQNLLGIENINPDDDLSEMDLDSLKIIIIGTEIYKKLNIRVPLDRLFEAATPREMSNIILNSDGDIKETTGTVVSAETFDASELSTDLDIPENILLTGGTGFFGSHVLKSLIRNTNANIYCLSRAETLENAYNRGKDIWNYYFNGQLEEYFDKRLFFITGDITKSRLGMESPYYEELAEKIDTVIHSAADVRHYGKYKDFQESNVAGTQRMIDFCFDGKVKKMHHISTIGVSGMPPQRTHFKESDLDIGQHFEGDVYGKSKFEAERLVHQARQNGLNTSIYRIGNLVGRYEDGFFQKNIETNQLYNDLKALILLGKYPASLEEEDFELTPVDLCGESLANLIILKDAIGYNFHLMNPYRLSFKTFIACIKQFGYQVEAVDFQTFSNHVYSEVKSKDFVKEITGMFYRMREENDSENNESPRVRYDCEFTMQVLNKTGFSWFELDFDYVSKMLKHGIDIGYF